MQPDRNLNVQNVGDKENASANSADQLCSKKIEYLENLKKMNGTKKKI